MKPFGLGRRSTIYRADDYLRAEVSTKEAARILGVTEGRWRQITTSRPTPDPILGEPITRPGTRGNQWPLRGVLAYALEKDQHTAVPIPPLLPLPSGERRYDSIKGRVWNAPAHAFLADPEPREVGGGVFAQMFAPRPYDLCGHEQPPVLMLTPLWPAADHHVIAHASHYVAQALEVPGWDTIMPSTPHLPVVIAPTGSEYSRVTNMIKVLEFDATALAALAPAFADPDEPQQWTPYRIGPAEDYYVDVSDIAACLGWPVLPYWPEGTATMSTCSRWKPGAPVDITVPASMQRRLEVARWLAHQPASSPEESDDLLSLAEKFHVRTYDPHRSQWNPKLPAGLELAVKINWPAPLAQPSSPTSGWRALDRLYDDPATPPKIADDLAAWIGDPAYARPSTLHFADLPAPWPGHFQAVMSRPAAVGEIPSTARWRRLVEAAGDVVPAYLRSAELGPLKAMTLFGPESVTWLAPTGFTPEEPEDDRPELAIPADPTDPPQEAILMRSSHKSHVITGWVRTLHGALAPLPAKAQWGLDDETTALVLTAALMGKSMREAQDAMNKRLGEALENRMDPVELPMASQLQLIGDVPIAITWSDLTRYAERTWAALAS